MRNSKLTLYIFVALILGIITGYIYNVCVIANYNNKINAADAIVKSIDARIISISDTAAAVYKNLQTQRSAQIEIHQANDAIINHKVQYFAVLSDIFLRLIKMIIAPLVFTSLVLGIAKVGDIKSVGRIGGKTLLWFLGATIVSLLLGMWLCDYFQPGRDMHLLRIDGHTQQAIVNTGLKLTDFINHIFPRSFFEAMTNNEVLQIVVFAIFFGIATASIGEKGDIIIRFIDACTQVVLKITGYVMKMAPLAVFGSIVTIVARQGLGILSTYAVFISEFYFALIILWLIIILAGFSILKRRVFTLVNSIKDAIIIAFSTSTSDAAYPKVLMEMEQFGCSNKIVSFVLPLGYSFNLDGGMMYMTFASLFLAQSYNVHLSAAQELSMLLILMLTSKGVAGVPRASLAIIAGTIAMFNIPEAGLALLIGIDPLLDMGRSATNVLGNAMATAVVSKWEGELND